MNETHKNYIIEMIKNIDKVQKEVIIEERTCVSCETSLLSKEYDTIPVAFISHEGHPFCVSLGVSSKRTQYFRIESIRYGRYATLRLLEAIKKKHHHHEGSSNDEHFVLVGTDFTCIIDLEDIGLVECFDPINVYPCKKN